MDDWAKSSERCKSVIDEINNQRMEEKANFKKSVNEKFERIEEKFEQVEKRLDKIEKRLDDNESSMKHMSQKLSNNETNMQLMNQKLDMILFLLQKKEDPGKKTFSFQDFNLEEDGVSLRKRSSP